MKSSNQRLFSINQQSLRRCESQLVQSWLLSLSLAQSFGHARTKMLRRRLKSAGQAVRDGLSALLLSLRQLFQNKRTVFGIVFLVVGLVSYFAHHFMFDAYDFTSHNVCSLLGFQPGQCWNGLAGAESRGWCYVSAFYYWDAVSLFIAIIFWSVAGFLLVPAKFGGVSSILFSFLNGFGWTMLIHRSFFTTSHESYHSTPALIVIVLGLSFGFGVVLSAKNIIYWWSHKARGNWQKWPAVHKLDIDQQLKNKLFDELTEDYYKVNRMI